MEKKKYIIKYPDKKDREWFKGMVRRIMCHQPKIDNTTTPPKNK